MAIVAFSFSFLLGKKTLQVLPASFFACGIVWLLMAIYIHFTRGDLMTNRIASLLSLQGTSILYVGTFLIAAIVGAIAGLTGYFLKGIVYKSNSSKITKAETVIS